MVGAVVHVCSLADMGEKRLAGEAVVDVVIVVV